MRDDDNFQDDAPKEHVEITIDDDDDDDEVIMVEGTDKVGSF